MSEPRQQFRDRAKEWASERWGGNFDGYPVQVEAYAHGLEDMAQEADARQQVVRERLESVLERVDTLEVMSQEAVRERNEQMFDLQRQTELRRQAESKCGQIRRQLHDERAKLAAVMDNIAEMMAQAQAWERATEATIRKAVAEGQERSIRGCAEVCERIAEEFLAEGDDYAADGLRRAARKILALLDVEQGPTKAK